MSTQATSEVARKLERLRMAQASTAEVIQRAKEKERERQEDLENLIAFVLDRKQATQTEIAKALGCSRDKMNRMAAAARKRDKDLLQAKSESNRRPVCVACGRYLPGEYPRMGLDQCWKCKKGPN